MNKMRMDIRNFSLAWRWTEPNQFPLKESVLRQLVPLSSERAQAINDMFSGHVRNAKINSDLYYSIVSHPADGPCSSFLASLNIPDDCEIIISWDADTALTTSWIIFKHHWEAFCYPGSDDVIIFSEKNKWILFYFHDEVFHFGKRKA